MRYLRYRKWVASIIVALCGLLLMPGSISYANSNGQLLYTPTSTNESNAYARVIELHHAGSNNGRLLATFEHWTNNGTPASYIIHASDNNGASWYTLATVPDQQTGAGHPVSQMWQPILFEFPQQLGSYPAGTILLVGNTVPADGSYTDFQQWRSLDHGKTWQSEGTVQMGGTFGKGIWEPFLFLDAQHQLVMEFSDERDSPVHSQMLSQMISNDGG